MTNLKDTKNNPVAKLRKLFYERKTNRPRPTAEVLEIFRRHKEKTEKEKQPLKKIARSKDPEAEV